jgi:hypothetical protein
MCVELEQKGVDMYKGILVALAIIVLAGCVGSKQAAKLEIKPVFDPDRDLERIQLCADGDGQLSAYAEIAVTRYLHASVIDEDVMDVGCQVSAWKLTLIRDLRKDDPNQIRLYHYHKAVRIRTSVLKNILASYVFPVPDDYGVGDSPYAPKRLHITYCQTGNTNMKEDETFFNVRLEWSFNHIWCQIVKHRIPDGKEDSFYFPTNNIWCVESINSSR